MRSGVRRVTLPLRRSRYLLIGKFDCYELSRQIGNKFNNTVKIFKNISNDDVNMNNHVESAIKFTCKLRIYPNNYFK